MKLTLTIDQTCEATGLGRTTVYRLLQEQELARLKVGSRTLITQESVEAYVQRRLAAAREQLELGL